MTLVKSTSLNILSIVAVCTMMNCTNQCPKKIIVSQNKSHLPIIDGKLAPGEWKIANKIEDFSFPWLNEKAPFTKFLVSVNSTKFNFAFQVEDSSHFWVPYKNELDVASGDRVEIFFASKKDLNEYYSLEINPKGKILDYKASFYRKFNEAWNFSELHVMTTINSNGYMVEGSIPLRELKSMGIYSEDDEEVCFFMGLYRADYVGSNGQKVRWISWIKPDSNKPEFHIPSSFGCLCLKG